MHFSYPTIFVVPGVSHRIYWDSVWCAFGVVSILLSLEGQCQRSVNFLLLKFTMLYSLFVLQATTQLGNSQRFWSRNQATFRQQNSIWSQRIWLRNQATKLGKPIRQPNSVRFQVEILATFESICLFYTIYLYIIFRQN